MSNSGAFYNKINSSRTFVDGKPVYHPSGTGLPALSTVRDYRQTSTGVLGIAVNGATTRGTDYSALNVRNATVAGSIQVAVGNSFNAPPGTRIDNVVLGTETVTLNNVRVFDDSPLYWFMAVQQGSNDLDLIAYTGPSVYGTQDSLASTAAKLEHAFNQQTASIIEGFNYTCDRFGAHGLCVSVGGRYTSADGEAERGSGAAVVAAKLNNNLRIGGWLDVGSYIEQPNGIEVENSEPIFGFYGVLNADASGAGWEVKVAGAYVNNDMTVTRGIFDDSEPGRGTTDLETYGVNGTISYNIPIDESWVVSPYAGARYTKTSAGAYTEATTSDVTTALSVAELDSDATTLLVGVKVSGALASNVGVFGQLGLEKELGRSASDYLATGVFGLTPEAFDPLNDTRLSAGLGAHIDLSATERLTFSGNYRGEPGQSDRYAATGMVFWTAGF